AVSRLDPFEHLDVVDSALAQPHGARLEATLRERKQDDLTLTVVNDRGSRYGCSRCGAAGLELDLREHPRLEQALAVVELETNGCAARGRVQRRIAVSDFGFESPTRKGVERHQRRLTDAHTRQIALVDVGDDPDPGKVSDAEQRFAGCEAGPLDRRFFQHDSVGGRVEGLAWRRLIGDL